MSVLQAGIEATRAFMDWSLLTDVHLDAAYPAEMDSERLDPHTQMIKRPMKLDHIRQARVPKTQAHHSHE